MHYVMSDIHGEFDRYKRMLDMIQFSDADDLYIIGDMIDRKAEGIEIVEDVMSRPNVHAMLGNHEQMCLDTFSRKFLAKQQWERNGGTVTYRTLQYKRSLEQRTAILHFMRNLPVTMDLEVNGKSFFLVHGWPGFSSVKEDMIWDRPTQFCKNPIEGKTVIVGHTPVLYFHVCKGQSATPYILELMEQNDHLRIFHGEGWMGIDCGCGNSTDVRRLACIRLEDGVEFYA